MGLKRLALLGFAGLLVLLFVGFAIAQGIGNPSVPSGAVAIVEDAPEGLGTVTEDEFQRALAQTAASAQVEPVPKPGDEKYDELKKAALGELFSTIWVLGLGEEMGLTPTPKEVSEELEKLKKQSFKTEKQFQEYLKQAHFTRAEVEQRVKIRILTPKIEAQVREEGGIPSSSEIEDYYEAAKASQYTTPESREIRTILNKDKAKAEAAKAALEKDDSTESWSKVAKKYSTDPETKEKGGLKPPVTESGGLPEPLKAAVFAAPQGQLEAPPKGSNGYTVFEVMKITLEKVQSLKEAKSQISTQLSEQASQQAFASFLRNYNSTWKSRTFCAADFTIERCANFKGDGRPEGAEAACYEANPKTPAEACPAPVTQPKPAQPGSASLLEPEGQKLAQRPRPAGEEAAAAALPEEPGVPPTGAPGK